MKGEQRGFLSGLRAARKIVANLRTQTEANTGQGRIKRAVLTEVYQLIDAYEREGPQEAITLYAKVRSADVQCPKCSTVDLLSTDLRRSKVDRRVRRGLGWDRDLSRWRCPECRRTYVVGIALWPAVTGGTPAPPIDTLQSADQTTRERLDRDRVERRYEHLARYWPDAPKGRRADQVNIELPTEDLK